MGPTPPMQRPASLLKAVARVGLAVSSAREWCDILFYAVREGRGLGIVTKKQLRQEHVHAIHAVQSVRKREPIKRLPYGPKLLS